MKFKKIILISLVLLGILMMGTVSATDSNNTDEMNTIENYNLLGDTSDIEDLSNCNNEESVIDESNLNNDVLSSTKSNSINYTIQNTKVYLYTIEENQITIIDYISGYPDSDVVFNIWISNYVLNKELGTVTLNFNGNSYTTNIFNGTGTIIAKAPSQPGSYKATLNYSGYTYDLIKYNYTPSSYTFTLDVIDDYDYEEYDEDIETYLYASKMTVKYKSNSYFKIKLMDWYDNPLRSKKISLKVWTGKKTKTYTLKTNSKGIAKFNTKNLKLGTHKVKITFKGKGNYLGNSMNSKIIVKKTIPAKKTTKKTNTITIKFKQSAYYPVKKTLKTKDTLYSIYPTNPNGQYGGGITLEIVYKGLSGYPIHTKVKKVNFYYKNIKTGKYKIKTVTKINNGKISIHVKSSLINGYKPIKAKVWYTSR